MTTKRKASLVLQLFVATALTKTSLLFRCPDFSLSLSLPPALILFSFFPLHGNITAVWRATLGTRARPSSHGCRRQGEKESEMMHEKNRERGRGARGAALPDLTAVEDAQWRHGGWQSCFCGLKRRRRDGCCGVAVLLSLLPVLCCAAGSWKTDKLAFFGLGFRPQWFFLLYPFFSRLSRLISPVSCGICRASSQGDLVWYDNGGTGEFDLPIGATVKQADAGQVIIVTDDGEVCLSLSHKQRNRPAGHKRRCSWRVQRSI